MNADQIVFQVQGSDPLPYTVTFTKNAELHVSCTCAAGKVGQPCKHRLSILTGDVSSVVSDNQADAHLLVHWLPNTKLAAALAAVEEAEQELARAKKKAADTKKALGRIMQAAE